MAKSQTRTNVIDDARARFESAFEGAQRDWKQMRKDADKRRKDIEARIERELKKLRAQVEKSPLGKRALELRDKAEERASELRSELRDSALGKRAEELREQAQARYSELLGRAGIATAADLEKLEKRLAALARELKTKRQPRGEHATA
jgi:hypothetical protein